MTISPAASANGAPAPAPDIIVLRRLNLFYGAFQALQDINATFPRQAITALIGPSGCGKSTLLRTLNRMNDLIEGVRIRARSSSTARTSSAPTWSSPSCAKRWAWSSSAPTPFPCPSTTTWSTAPASTGSPEKPNWKRSWSAPSAAVQIWDEVKDRLKTSALALTEEQQQRLCIARLLAVEPEILLMDEPCSALDPMATLRIEELMQELKKNYTIIIVTHNMQQAARASDHTGFMYLGELIEFGPTGDIFTRPKDSRTEDYITGKYG